MSTNQGVHTSVNAARKSAYATSLSCGERFGMGIAGLSEMGRESFQGAAAFVPDRKTLPVLRKAVQKCKGCDLFRYATQAVIGEGPKRPHPMLIREQPGNDEDCRAVRSLDRRASCCVGRDFRRSSAGHCVPGRYRGAIDVRARLLLDEGPREFVADLKKVREVLREIP